MMKLLFAKLVLVIISSIVVSTAPTLTRQLQSDDDPDFGPPVYVEQKENQGCNEETYNKTRYCQQGWQRNYAAPICLKVLYDEVDYFTAEENCQSHDARLLVIEDEAVEKNIILGNDIPAFIGLRYVLPEGSTNNSQGYWRWNNGKNTSRYSNFGHISTPEFREKLKKESFRCAIFLVAFYSARWWMRVDCLEDKYAYICERSVEKSFYSVFVTTPSQYIKEGEHYIDATCYANGDHEKEAVFQIYFALKNGTGVYFNKRSLTDTSAITTFDNYRYESTHRSKFCKRDIVFVLHWQHEVLEKYTRAVISCCVTQNGAQYNNNKVKYTCSNTSVPITHENLWMKMINNRRTKPPNITEIERKKEDEDVTYLSCDACAFGGVLTWGITAGGFETILTVDDKGNAQSSKSKALIDQVDFSVVNETATTTLGLADTSHFISTMRVNSELLFVWSDKITVRCCSFNLSQAPPYLNAHLGRLCQVHVIYPERSQPPILTHTLQLKNKQLLGHLTCSAFVGSGRILSWSVSAGSFNVLLFVDKHGKVTSSKLQAYVNHVEFLGEWDHEYGHYFTSNIIVKLRHFFKLTDMVNVTCYSYDVSKGAPKLSFDDNNTEPLWETYSFHRGNYSDHIVKKSFSKEKKMKSLLSLFLMLSVPIVILSLAYCYKEKDDADYDGRQYYCNGGEGEDTPGNCALPQYAKSGMSCAYSEASVRSAATAQNDDFRFTEENIEAIGYM